MGGSWDRTNRGIDDLEPGQTYGTLPNGKNIAYINSEDMRSYQYYRTRYGFDLGVDDRVTSTMTVYLKELFADFHDYGEASVYTPNAGKLIGVNGTQPQFDNTGDWQYRHYIRRPDQQVFSFLTGGASRPIERCHYLRIRRVARTQHWRAGLSNDQLQRNDQLKWEK